MSGRDGVCEADTIDWLKDNAIPYDEFYIRSADDSRDDRIVKRELFDKHVLGKYNVIAVIDDRPKVCQMWRSIGLNVVQIGNPTSFFERNMIMPVQLDTAELLKTINAQAAIIKNLITERRLADLVDPGNSMGPEWVLQEPGFVFTEEVLDKPSRVNLIRYISDGTIVHGAYRKITLAIVIDYATQLISFGWADSGPEQFSRATGREIALKRLKDCPVNILFTGDISNNGVVHQIFGSLCKSQGGDAHVLFKRHGDTFNGLSVDFHAKLLRGRQLDWPSIKPKPNRV
jgi:hypothetical protein